MLHDPLEVERGAEALARRNKSFTDTTLPLGVDGVEYIVQPKRGEVSGPQSNVFSVQFGSVAPGGAATIARIESTPHEQPVGVRIAA